MADTLRYMSVCSGIEAASVAWEPLGWRPVAFSEIEPFPCAVLAHHWPQVPNHGDMTKFQEWPDHAIDLLCGGTPCQSFSVAGLRKGLADPRGNLMLTFGAIAGRYRPRWLVWENVPGVLSSNGGRDFGAFLGMLGQLGYGVAYRVLDAQYVRTRRFPRAVPQRRRRVFVVGYLGDWRRAAAVLFDRESLSGNPPPRREAGQGAAGNAGSGAAGSHWDSLNNPHPSLNQSHNTGGIGASNQEVFSQRGAGIVPAAGCFWNGEQVTQTLDAVLQARNDNAPQAAAFAENTRGELRLEGGDGSRTGALSTGGGKAGQGVPMAVIPFDTTQITSPGNYSRPKPGDAMHPLAAGAHPPAIAVCATGDIAHTLKAEGFDGSEDGTGRGVPTIAVHGTQDPLTQAECGFPLGRNHGQENAVLAPAMAVRRLTPRECERLQGFPDNHTLVPHRGKPAADGPRYKAIGNSWAVNCAEWIGERIAEVDQWG